jgi:hypothetical protein
MAPPSKTPIDFAPRELLAVVDLAQIQNLALHHATSGHAAVLDNAELSVLLAVLLPNRVEVGGIVL